MKTDLYSYTCSIIEDDYAFGVLYAKIKELTFDCSNVNSIYELEIEPPYVENTIGISFQQNLANKYHVLMTLLSLRTLKLNRDLLSSCSDSFLLFNPNPIKMGKWAHYHVILESLPEDCEISMIIRLIDQYSGPSGILKETVGLFKNGTSMPAPKYLLQWYSRQASECNDTMGVVIPDCHFVEDNGLEEYKVPENVKYVGNTAFSFCHKLRKIVIGSHDLMFGVCPIIECNLLKAIIVPQGSLDYYRTALPFYKDMIFDHDVAIPDSIEQEKNLVENKVDASQKSDSPIVEKGKVEYVFDHSKLKQIFDNKVTTYKYFWYISILQCAKEERVVSIPFKDLTIKMISLAWPLVNTCGLDFGKTDQMKKMMDEMKSKATVVKAWDSIAMENYLKKSNNKTIMTILAPLMKNVPYRFLSPWIQYTTDDDVIQKSRKPEFRCPYALYDDCVVLDEQFYEYAIANYDNQMKFANNALKEYLKQHNDALSMLKFLTCK